MKVGAFQQLLWSQILDWQNTISYKFRFILCGIFAFLAYFILSQLGKIAPEFLSLLDKSAFEFRVFILGYAGLLFSILAAALFNSLLPKKQR